MVLTTQVNNTSGAWEQSLEHFRSVIAQEEEKDPGWQIPHLGDSQYYDLGYWGRRLRYEGRRPEADFWTLWKIRAAMHCYDTMPKVRALLAGYTHAKFDLPNDYCSRSWKRAFPFYSWKQDLMDKRIVVQPTSGHQTELYLIDDVFPSHWPWYEPSNHEYNKKFSGYKITEGWLVVTALLIYALKDIDWSDIYVRDYRDPPKQDPVQPPLLLVGKSHFEVIQCVSALSLAIATAAAGKEEAWWNWWKPGFATLLVEQRIRYDELRDVPVGWDRCLLVRNDVPLKADNFQQGEGKKWAEQVLRWGGSAVMARMNAISEENELTEAVRSFGGSELLWRYLTRRAQMIYEYEKKAEDRSYGESKDWNERTWADFYFPEPREVPPAALPQVREAMAAVCASYKVGATQSQLLWQLQAELQAQATEFRLDNQYIAVFRGCFSGLIPAKFALHHDRILLVKVPTGEELLLDNKWYARDKSGELFVLLRYELASSFIHSVALPQEFAAFLQATNNMQLRAASSYGEPLEFDLAPAQPDGVRLYPPRVKFPENTFYVPEFESMELRHRQRVWQEYADAHRQKHPILLSDEWQQWLARWCHYFTVTKFTPEELLENWKPTIGRGYTLATARRRVSCID